MLIGKRRASYRTPRSNDMQAYLELGILRSTWEWNHIAYVLHARNEEYEALEAQTEACMRTASVLAGVEVPAVGFLLHATRINLVQELVHVLFAHRATDDFAYTRSEEHTS